MSAAPVSAEFLRACKLQAGVQVECGFCGQRHRIIGGQANPQWDHIKAGEWLKSGAPTTIHTMPIQYTQLMGKTCVIACDCAAAAGFENALETHADLISRYMFERAKRMLARSPASSATKSKILAAFGAMNEAGFVKAKRKLTLNKETE